MIDEVVLANLLTEHAERIPVPESAIDDLLIASPQPDERVTRRFTNPSGRMLAAAAVVVMVGAGTLWAVSAHSGGGSSATVAKTAANEQLLRSDAKSQTRGQAGVPSAAAGVHGFTASPGGSSAKTSAGVGVPATAPPSASAPKDTARVVRTGTLDLQVKRHTFGETISRITTIASGAGGYISDQKTYESAAVPSGTVTLRVPSAHFDATVERLRALGTVVSASTSGVDVTGQYTDLQARLGAATATRDQYLVILSSAKNIGDILSIQDRIQSVQTQIDQLQGQINELDNQTTYGTITTSVTEPGPKPKPPVRPAHKSGISVAWDNARNGFARRIEGLISHSGSALVVVVGLLLLAYALRLLVPRVRRLLV